MRFRPCIDLHDGKVKQIIGSTFKSSSLKDSLQVNFSSKKPPSYFASLYRRDNLKGGHIIKLGAGNDQAAEEALKCFSQGLQIGGGVNIENAKEWLNKGASHVIITSAIFNQGKLLMDKLLDFSSVCGPKRLVIDLSCAKKGKDYVVMTDGWSVFSEEKIDKNLFDKLAPFCDEFLIHAVGVEGKQQGVDRDLIKILSSVSLLPKDSSLVEGTKCRIVYAGGIHHLDEIEYLEKQSEGRLDFTIGSSLDIFGGHLKYSEIAKRFG